MIIVATRIETTPGMVNEALKWAEKIWNILEKVGGLGSKSWILRGESAQLNRFTFAIQFASMAEYEEAMKKANAVPEYQALIPELSKWGAKIERTFSQVVKES